MVNAMKLICVMMLMFTSSCAATLVSTPKEGMHVIGYRTGKFGTDWYDRQFDEKAKEQCKGPYEIVEKSDNPEVLKTAGILVQQYDFYWVVKCI